MVGKKGKGISLTVVPLSLLLASSSSLGAEAPPAEQPQLEVNVEPSKPGAPPFVTWKLRLKEGTKLNFDGPWSLKVTGEVSFSEGTQWTWDKSQFDTQQNQFKVSIKGAVTAPKTSQFKLTYFYCDTQNKWCRRVTESGEVKLIPPKSH
jgi:hypothetical protein